MIILPATGMNAIKRMENNKPSFVIIDWTDVYGVHSCVFSFEGNDSVQNAMNARNRFLQTLKPLKSVRF